MCVRFNPIIMKLLSCLQRGDEAQMGKTRKHVRVVALSSNIIVCNVLQQQNIQFCLFASCSQNTVKYNRFEFFVKSFAFYCCTKLHHFLNRIKNFYYFNGTKVGMSLLNVAISHHIKNAFYTIL